MTYRKVYAALPMDCSVVAALNVMRGLGMDEGEFRVEYRHGLGTLYVAADKACLALDGLIDGGMLNQDEAWGYFIATTVALP